MLLLAVTLAFVRVQENYRTCPTILLLDDVAAHLDDQHRLILFQEICGPTKDSAKESSKRPFQVWYDRNRQVRIPRPEQSGAIPDGS